MAMCVGGPPKPVQPMRPHSLAMVDSATSGRASGVGSSGPGSSGMPHVGTTPAPADPRYKQDRRHLLERADVRVGAGEVRRASC